MGMAKLVVVDIALKPRPGQPAAHFREHELHRTRVESGRSDPKLHLNGFGPTLQTRLYEQFWRPMEVDFGQKNYDTAV